MLDIATAIGTMAGRKRGGIMPAIFAALIFQRPTIEPR